jgi:rod shape-determining protein MreB and related proteins
MSLRWRHESRSRNVSGAFALDLGSSVTRVASPSGEMLFEEPTLAAVGLSGDRLLAFGTEAASFGAHSAGHVAMIRPVRAGKLVDVDVATAVVAEVFRRIGVGRLEHREVALCIHVDASAVQRRALERAIRQAGSMVVDVGGGTSNVGVMALGGLVATAAADIGGLDFDQAIRAYLAREHGLALSQRRVEMLRRRHGSLAPAEPNLLVVVEGRDAKSGRPSSAEVTEGELAFVLDRVVEPLMALAVRCITEAPPDVANDLVGAGLTLVGGGSRLAGLDERLATATGVPVHVPAEPERLSVRGAARCLAEDYISVKTVTELKFG